MATLRNLRDLVFENIPQYSLYESFSVLLMVDDPLIAFERIRERGRSQEIDKINIDYLKRLDRKHREWFLGDLWPLRGLKGTHRESKYGGFVMSTAAGVEISTNRLIDFIVSFCFDPKLTNLHPHIGLACRDNIAFSNTCIDCINTASVVVDLLK